MRRKDPESMLVPKKLGKRGVPPARLLYERAGGMPCSVCGAAGTLTIDSRPRPAGIRRRRCCAECGHRFTTWEIIGDNPDVAKIAYQTIVHELRQLTERVERLAEMSGEIDRDEDAA